MPYSKYLEEITNHKSSSVSVSNLFMFVYFKMCAVIKDMVF